MDQTVPSRDIRQHMAVRLMDPGRAESLHMYDPAIIQDDKDEFLNFIKGPSYNDAVVGDSIFDWDSLKCGIALFEGRTPLNINKVFTNGETPFHLAATYGASSLFSYLLKGGAHNFDPRDINRLNDKGQTPLDVAFDELNPRGVYMECTAFRHLVDLCSTKGESLEAARILVKKTQNEEQVVKRFFDYAENGKVIQLGALFLAVPEMLVSCPGGGIPPLVAVYRRLLVLEGRTLAEEMLLLLLDVFVHVGDKLAAYLRLEDPHCDEVKRNKQLAYLLHEVAPKMQGVTTSEDYFWRYIKRTECGNLAKPGYKPPVGMVRYSADDILLSLEAEAAERLNEAIEKKLSICTTLRDCMKVIREMTRQDIRERRRGVELENACLTPAPML